MYVSKFDNVLHFLCLLRCSFRFVMSILSESCGGINLSMWQEIHSIHSFSALAHCTKNYEIIFMSYINAAALKMTRTRNVFPFKSLNANTSKKEPLALYPLCSLIIRCMFTVWSYKIWVHYYILRFICNLLSVLTDDFKCSAAHCGIDLPGYAKNREYK